MWDLPGSGTEPVPTALVGRFFTTEPPGKPQIITFESNFLSIILHYFSSESHSVMSNSLQSHGLSMEFSRSEYWSAWPIPSPGDLPNPGIKPRSPTLQADSLPAEPQGKPKNTGVGSLSLLQGIFPTQKLNRGLLHWRWIFYQLSYQGSPEG